MDITLIKDSKEINMPTPFDQINGASRDYANATIEQKNNALYLEKIMVSSGFIPLPSEWWHFDDSDYQNYNFIANFTNSD